ncbi:MAG TPA: hypothetical protein DHW40_11070 [Microbacterium sp.]|nr:hypothetical protein [Microbacterium sp.]
MTKKTASQLAAERLGYGGDPHDETLADAETLLGRTEWTDDDRRAARATLERAASLGPRRSADEEEATEQTASELAGAQLAQQSESARRRSAGWA